MATFKNEMRVPKAIPRSIASWLIWLLGGTVEVKEKDTEHGRRNASYIESPTHSWGEIELPRSNCYLTLGGQTSTFRDRGIHGFRVVLHDTTFRFWEREQGKLTYEGLLLHRPMHLSRAHVDVLKHIIDNGDWRQDVQSDQFDRSMDQDTDLSPVFVEFPPAKFLFQDDAMVSMAASYVGLFDAYRRLPLAAKPAVNCVVVALLFGKSPQTLLSLLPRRQHDHTRERARELNDLWQRELGPVVKRAGGVFKAVDRVARAPKPLSWWQRLLPRALLPGPGPSSERMVLDFQQQVERFRPDFLNTVMLPLRRALLQHDPGLQTPWSRAFPIVDALLDYRLDAFQLLRGQTKDGCEAESAVDQLLFCPDWRATRHWQKAQKGHRPEPPSGATIVKETNIAVRRLLYWDAANKINLETGIPDDPMNAKSCLSRGEFNFSALQACLAHVED